MNSAGLPTTLNRRHKSALCATLICVGFILLLGGSVRAAVGITLLGVAFSWALGANLRVVHWLFIVFGLLLLIPAVADGILWPQVKPAFIQVQTTGIENDQNMLKMDMDLAVQETDKQEKRKDDAEVAKDQATLFRDEQELRTLRADGVFRHIIKDDWQWLAGGMLLLSAGVGLIIGIKQTGRNRSEIAT
jgi:hypothetical protein